MALIRCPGCGKSVLSIASTCPGCGQLLITNPTARQNGYRYRACQHCGKLVAPHARVCVYCGHRTERPRALRRVAASLAGTAVIALAAVLTLSMGSGAEPARAPSAGRPADQRPALPPPPQIASPLSTTTAVVAAHPEPARTNGAHTAQDGRPAPGRLVRWTETWANVREGRDLRSPVARVLQPGVRVEVTDRREGWWTVYVDGVAIGHVSNAVLTRTPPADTRNPG